MNKTWNKGQTPYILLIKQFLETTNPVTKSVLRDIIRNRIYDCKKLNEESELKALECL